MQVGQDEYAKRKALELFDDWLEVTGIVDRFSGYYYELQGIIKDAVEIGAMTALGVEYKVKDGELIKTELEVRAK